ncbi:MAG: 2-oxo acid dehydrogenase subunit E2 [Planctomycetota bacterium]
MSIEVRLPDNLGDNIDGGDIVSFLVEEGEAISKDQDLLEMETDKAVVTIPSPEAGTVEKIHAEAGTRVAVGDLLLTLAAGEGAPAATEAASAPAEPAAPAAPAESAPPAAPAAPPPAAPAAPAPVVPAATSTNGRPAPAGPATRRLARELGVDLHQVKGKGPGGRISRDDLKAFVNDRMKRGGGGGSAAVEAPPLPDFSQWGEIEVKPASGIRKATAEAMAVSWRTVPHVTQFDEANISRLEAARKRYEKVRPEGQAKITVTAVAVKAVVTALKAFPQFNASFDAASGEVIYKNYYHIGIAVDTEHGLVVPVIRDADKKTVAEIAADMASLAKRARDRKLGLDDMRGGTFTITNLGGIGGTGFTPIVNYPEVAILGMARAKQQPVLRDGQLRSQLVLPLSMSYDHRLIDGADGARFVRYLVRLLEEPFQLILEL